MGNIHRIPRANKFVTRWLDYLIRRPSLWKASQAVTQAKSKEARLTPYERYRFKRWLWWRYGPDCAYCGRYYPLDAMTIDHIQPRSKGGAVRDIQNMALACMGCNKAKGNTWEDLHYC